jgi:hypothetical protein
MYVCTYVHSSDDVSDMYKQWVVSVAAKGLKIIFGIFVSIIYKIKLIIYHLKMILHKACFYGL